MALLDEILQLSGEWPDWQSDALRRLFATGRLREQDLVEMRAMVEGKPEAPTPIRLDISHVPHLGDGQTIVLLELRDLEHVNGFAAGRAIRFAPSGLNVVFGENGAGKSGFSRVVKRACRARRSLPVLPDAFANDRGTPTAIIVAQDSDGSSAAHTWREGLSTSPQLAMIAVYDSLCGNDYITQEGTCDFQPYGLPFLGQLTQAMSTVQAQVGRDRDTITLDTTPFQELRGDHAVGRRIKQLGATTDLAALRYLASMTEAEAQRIGEIEKIQSTLDVETPAKAADAMASRLDQAAMRAKNIEKLTSDAAIDRLLVLAASVQLAEEADKVAQSLLRGEDADVLPGTGGGAWKTLFQAAQAFSLEAYPKATEHPTTTEGARCVLCQQDLALPAKLRLQAFRTYVAGAAATELTTATASLAKGVELVGSASREVLDEATTTELQERDPLTLALIELAQKAWEARQQWAADAAATGNWHCPRPSPAADPPLSQVLTEKAKGQRDKAAELRKSKDEAQLLALATEHSGLVARRTLATMQPQVEQFVEDAKRRKHLDQVYGKLRTQTLSTLITRLSHQYVTQALAETTRAELKQLGSRVRPPVLRSLTRRGENFLVLSLEQSNAHPGEVLSEGEQRAIGLALFLAEARLRGDRSTIVFDDPSTSLDHHFRERIAKRLVALAQERPVIVFTHDAVFLTQVQMALTDSGAKALFQTVEWADGKPGAVMDGLAWENKSFGAQFQEIYEETSAFATAANPHLNDAERRKMRDLHARLRGALERGVRDVILNGVVHPFVDEIKVARLGAVAGFSLDEWRQVLELHDHCSAVIAAHDTNRDRQQEIPHPIDLLDKLKKIRVVFDGCSKRAKDFDRDIYNPHMEKRSAPRKA